VIERRVGLHQKRFDVDFQPAGKLILKIPQHHRAAHERLARVAGKTRYEPRRHTDFGLQECFDRGDVLRLGAALVHELERLVGKRFDPHEHVVTSGSCQ
jgi:hypothetical protein